MTSHSLTFLENINLERSLGEISRDVDEILYVKKSLLRILPGTFRHLAVLDATITLGVQFT